jgi:hypothetical protein
MPNTFRTLLFVSGVTLLSTGCRDSMGPPIGENLGPPPTLMKYGCVADRVALSVSCTEMAPQGEGLRRSILGQNQVKLTSTNVSWNAATGILQADVTVKNLLGEPIGTSDGSVMTGVKVFHATGPTVTAYYAPGDTGTATVHNPDGVDFFNAQRQPYFSYAQILVPNEVSAAKVWQWHLSPAVKTFAFTLQVFTTRPSETGAIRLEYICGSIFRLQHFADSSATVTYSVTGSPETPTLRLSRRGRGAVASEFYFQAATGGDVQVRHNGTVVASRANGGTVCQEKVFLTATEISTTEPALHINPADPVLVTKPIGNGEVAQYLVERGEDGTPIRLTGVRRFNPQDPDHKDVLWYGTNGLPSSMQLRDSTQATFEYGQDGQGTVTFRLPDGKKVASPFQLGDLEAPVALTKRATPRSSRRTPARPRMDQTQPVHFVDISVRIGQDGNIPYSEGTVAGEWSYETQDGEAGAGPLAIASAGNGEYLARLPLEPAETPQNAVRRVCNLIDRAEAFCDVMQASRFAEVFATVVCAGLAASGNPVVVRAASACLAFIVLAELSCIMEANCSNLLRYVNHLLAADSRLRIVITVSGKDMKPAEVVRYFEDPLDTRLPIEVRLGRIVQQSLEPREPAYGEPYSVVTRVWPVQSGISVRNEVLREGDLVPLGGTGFTDTDGRFATEVPWKSCGPPPVNMSRAALRLPRLQRLVSASGSGFTTTNEFISHVFDVEESLTFVAPADERCRASFVEISPASSRIKPGEAIQLSATVSVDGQPRPNAEVSWWSEDPAIATVNASGVVTGQLKGGFVIIHAEYGDLQGSSSIHVQNRNILGMWPGKGHCGSDPLHDVTLEIRPGGTFAIHAEYAGEFLDGEILDDGLNAVRLFWMSQSLFDRKIEFELSEDGNFMDGRQYAKDGTAWVPVCSWFVHREGFSGQP